MKCIQAHPKLNDGQVTDEIVNDSLGTVDKADTMDTDPKDDPEAEAECHLSCWMEDSVRVEDSHEASAYSVLRASF
jgi:hypothetical protein